MPKFLRIKEWETYQHYKDRNPSWIKLHKRLLDDFDFHRLPVDSRALAPMLWLLASESREVSTGLIEMDFERIGYRLRTSADSIEKSIKPLISSGFVIVSELGSTVLAEPEQEAIPEKRREETYTTEKELEGKSEPAPFNRQETALIVAKETHLSGSHILKTIEQQLVTFSVGTPLRVAAEAMIVAITRYKELKGTKVFFWLSDGAWLRPESEWEVPGQKVSAPDVQMVDPYKAAMNTIREDERNDRS